ncbi:GNAT family N-acetyltransferase, partial [Streptococcus suis]
MKWEIKTFEHLSLHELYTILTLRTAVFVVEQACPYPEIDGKDPSCLHLLVTDNGEFVAYVRILPAGLS